MKERPILFSAPMVRAILDGSKTQTRRVVKPQPVKIGTNAVMHEPCSYGQTGDRLWVKETWRPIETSGSTMRVQYPHTDSELHFTRDQIPHTWRIPKAAARGNVSPLFMPRWASRITLEVTGVRVERLQDISEADAIAEGVEYERPIDPRDAFRSLWWSINGVDSWDANPWVWVVEFKRVTP